MKLSTTVALVVTGWMATITTLHAWLNLESAHATGGGPAFRVGFLPVT